MTPLRFVAAFALALPLVPAAQADIDLSFEPADANELHPPAFTGSTVGISGGTANETINSDSSDANDRMNPADGPLGTASYVTVFRFLDDEPADAGEMGAFVRITDFPDRHLLSKPSPGGGIGLHFKFTGEAASMEISVVIREDPTITGDNEVYEATVWRPIETDPDWQYLHWDFHSDIVADPDQNWATSIALGDGIYDGGGVTDATAFEGVLLRPIPGQTVTGVDVIFRLDDIHTGPPHSPLDPVEGLGLMLR